MTPGWYGKEMHWNVTVTRRRVARAFFPWQIGSNTVVCFESSVSTPFLDNTYSTLLACRADAVRYNGDCQIFLKSSGCNNVDRVQKCRGRSRSVRGGGGLKTETYSNYRGWGVETRVARQAAVQYSTALHVQMAKIFQFNARATGHVDCGGRWSFYSV